MDKIPRTGRVSKWCGGITADGKTRGERFHTCSAENTFGGERVVAYASNIFEGAVTETLMIEDKLRQRRVDKCAGEVANFCNSRAGRATFPT